MITTEQNTERQLQRLGAQRQLYSMAKKVFGWQLILSGPVAITSAFLAIPFPSAKGYIAAWGLIVTFCDLLWLMPWQKRLRDKAALVQELFDCDVLSLSWNELKAGRRPDPELIKEQYDKYQSREDKMPPLMNWYANEVGSLPLHIGRIACQRSNCWWDSNQRRRYAFWVIGIVLVIFGALLGIAIGNKLTVGDFMLTVAAPMAPAFLLGVRQFTDQMEAAKRLDTLKDHCERLWHDALDGKSESELTSSARGLQYEILENRRRSPLVFDFVYNSLRNNYEFQMNHGVADLVGEAKRKLVE